MVLLSLAFLISGIVQIVFGSYLGGGYMFAAAIVNLLVVYLMKSTFFDAVDLGKFKEAADKLIIWTVVALIFGVLGGLMLLFAYLRMNDIFQTNYQPYPAGQYQTGQAQAPPQQYQAPPSQAPTPQPAQSQPAPPVAAQPEHKPEMVKCKKCGVQYPAFMRTCPNCNEPR